MKGFVFDFDGLIFDTETPNYTVYHELFAEYGYELTLKQWSQIIGTWHADYDPLDHLVQVAGDHHERADFKKLIDERMDALLAKQKPMPGVEEFLQKAHSFNIPMAVASSSPKPWVMDHLEQLGLTRYFQHVLTMDDVSLPKPDPELYHLAAKRLQITPGELVACEDSLNGVKSAKSAGFYCIAVPNEMTREMPLQLADRIVSSFFDMQLDELLAFTPEINSVNHS